MVRIEKLSMQGFKSFANKTALPFPSGFNVICGANGSGKSNIVDALCFVLGIRSAKTIRADKLEHLIFNGGKKRASAKYGIVNLYLNNEDGAIPGEEPLIKITRKINKNGVSVYKLNGRTVNRRKIVDVLANAGIYADGHNIIMQGDITNLIEMTPLERKEIIDEVSGIAEFEDKKTKAENELAKVDTKLKEAQIILNEREKALKKLEREQKLAREYKTLEPYPWFPYAWLWNPVQDRTDASLPERDKFAKKFNSEADNFTDHYYTGFTFDGSSVQNEMAVYNNLATEFLMIMNGLVDPETAWPKFKERAYEPVKTIQVELERQLADFKK